MILESYLFLLKRGDPRLEVALLLLELLLALPVPLHQVSLGVGQLLLLLANLFKEISVNQFHQVRFLESMLDFVPSAQRPPPFPSPS